jgi:hypothetical protein
VDQVRKKDPNSSNSQIDRCNRLKSVELKIRRAKMGMLPFDDWIYHLNDRREEVNRLHSALMGLEQQLQNYTVDFNRNLDDYKSMVAVNSALVIVTNIIKMADEKYQDYAKTIDAEPPPVAGSIPTNVASLISEFVGGGQILKAIFQFRKFAPNLFTEAGEEVGEVITSGLIEAAAEAGVEATSEATVKLTTETVGETVGETAAEAAIEGVSLSGLASTGVGIVLAVGIDAILGAINGSKEKDKLDKQINNLQTALNKCTKYLNTLQKKGDTINEGLVKEGKRFEGLIGAISQVGERQPTFDYKFDPIPANAQQVIKAQQAALQEYGEFVKLREDWINASKRKPGLAKKDFIESVMLTVPPDETESTIEKDFDVLAKYSDIMKAGQNTH